MNIRTLPVFFLACLLGFFALADGSVAEWARNLETPVLSGAGLAVEGVEIPQGHLRIRLQKGTLYPVQANGQPVSVFFSGRGNLLYRTDRSEETSFRTNVSDTLSRDLDASGSLDATFSTLLFAASGGLDTINQGKPWPTAPPDAAGAESFRQHCEFFSQVKGYNLSVALAPAMAERPTVPSAFVQAGGDAHQFLYKCDSLFQQDETLWVVDKWQSDLSFLKDRRYTQMLSRQPISRPRLDPPPRPYTLTDLDVTVVNSHDITAHVAARETFRILQPTRILSLALWSSRVITRGAMNAYTEKFYQLKKVTMGDGSSVGATQQPGVVYLELPRIYQPGETLTLNFEMEGDILEHPNNDSYWELGTSAWYPFPRIDMQAYTFHAVCKVKKPFAPFATGETVRRWEEGDLQCGEFREEKPVQIAVILAGKYQTYAEEANGLKVSVSSYANSNPIATKQLAKMVRGIIEFYKPFFGEFPFKELKVLEINAYGFGQAPPGVIFITKEAFSPQMDTVSSILSENINARIAHEIAHFWWGHVGMLGATEQSWMSESFAEYVSACAMSALQGAREMDRKLSLWKADAKSSRSKSSMYTVDNLVDDNNKFNRYKILYANGPLVLHAFRLEVGDQAFFTILKSYLRSFPYRPMDTKAFLAVAKVVTKKDYADWFEKYLLDGADPTAHP